MAISHVIPLKLDINKGYMTVPKKAHVRVGDVGSTTLQITITDRGEPVSLTGYTVRLDVMKPDNTYYMQTGTASGSVATFTLGAQAVSSPGVSKHAYVSILSGNTWICSTEDFDLVVHGCVDVEGPESQSWYDYLEEVAEGISVATGDGTVLTNAQIDAMF